MGEGAVLTMDDATRANVTAALAVEYSLAELEQLGDLFRREATRRMEVAAEIAGLTERVDWDDLGMAMMLARRDYHREYYQERAAYRPAMHTRALVSRNAKRRADYAALTAAQRESVLIAKRAKDNAAYHAQPEEVRKAKKRAEHERARRDPQMLERIREQQRAAQRRYNAKKRAQAQAAE